jgi:hypothetical protein
MGIFAVQRGRAFWMKCCGIGPHRTDRECSISTRIGDTWNPHERYNSEDAKVFMEPKPAADLRETNRIFEDEVIGKDVMTRLAKSIRGMPAFYLRDQRSSKGVSKSRLSGNKLLRVWN